MKRQFLFLICALFLKYSQAQQPPIVHIEPFKGYNTETKAMAATATALFKSLLSQKGRLHFVSRQAWQRIFETYRLILTLNDFRDSETAIKLGKMTSVDFIAVGQIFRQYGETTLNIDWINLRNGLIEKTFEFSVNNSDELQKGIESAVNRLNRWMLKDGFVLKSDGPLAVRIARQDGAIWLKGDEFFLVNNLHYPYARVRLNEIKGNEVLAELLYCNDRIRAKDRVVPVEYFEPLPSYRPCANLQVQSALGKAHQKELLYGLRKLILDSGKFDLVEQRPSASCINFSLQVLQKRAGPLFMVHLLLTEGAEKRILFEQDQDCLETDIEKTANVLLMLALSRRDKIGLVTQVSGTELNIDLGKNHRLYRKQEVLFKEPGVTGLTAKGRLKQVYADHSLAVLDEEAQGVRAGCLAVFPQNQDETNVYKQSLQKINERTNKEKERLYER